MKKFTLAVLALLAVAFVAEAQVGVRAPFLRVQVGNGGFANRSFFRGGFGNNFVRTPFLVNGAHHQQFFQQRIGYSYQQYAAPIIQQYVQPIQLAPVIQQIQVQPIQVQSYVQPIQQIQTVQTIVQPVQAIVQAVQAVGYSGCGTAGIVAPLTFGSYGSYSGAVGVRQRSVFGHY